MLQFQRFLVVYLFLLKLINNFPICFYLYADLVKAEVKQWYGPFSPVIWSTPK